MLFISKLTTIYLISHFPVENRKESMDCSEGQTQSDTKLLNAGIGARKYKRCLVVFKEKPQTLLALYVQCFTIGLLHCPSKQSMHVLRSSFGNGDLNIT